MTLFVMAGHSPSKTGVNALAPAIHVLSRPCLRRRVECAAQGRADGANAMTSTNPTTFVLVHGAWHGGWCYARVAALLRARGHTVFTPTLTGQGERAHLLSGAINLSTHIEDVLGVFRSSV